MALLSDDLWGDVVSSNPFDDENGTFHVLVNVDTNGTDLRPKSLRDSMAP